MRCMRSMHEVRACLMLLPLLLSLLTLCTSTYATHHAGRCAWAVAHNCIPCMFRCSLANLLLGPQRVFRAVGMHPSTQIVQPAGGGLRSRVFINGAASSLRVLKELGAMLVDTNGQHSSLALKDADTQVSEQATLFLFIFLSRIGAKGRAGCCMSALHALE